MALFKYTSRVLCAGFLIFSAHAIAARPAPDDTAICPCQNIWELAAEATYCTDGIELISQRGGGKPDISLSSYLEWVFGGDSFSGDCAEAAIINGEVCYLAIGTSHSTRLSHGNEFCTGVLPVEVNDLDSVHEIEACRITMAEIADFLETLPDCTGN